MKSRQKFMFQAGKIAVVTAAVVAMPAQADPVKKLLATPTTPYDLTLQNSVSVTGDFSNSGSTTKAIFENWFEQPAGTGVFKPFLTLERAAAGGNPSYYEQAYNTAGAPLYLDQQRPEWNTTLKLGDLEQQKVGDLFYYCFILDANEPGQDKSLISIDNIRIYTSPSDNTATVGNDLSKLDQLGTLQWALNEKLLNADGSFNDDPWVLLDSDQDNVISNANGGSGQADMRLLVPVDAFAGASDTDFLWFYNLNGVKYSADSDYGAEAGYEEWKACVKATPGRDDTGVPDAGSTMTLFGLGLAVVGILGRRSRQQASS